jgi:histidinol-phosphate aminotransferase
VIGTSPTLLRLDRNEGPPPPVELLRELAALSAEDLARYPDGESALAGVEAAWAARLGVDPARVVLTTGGDGAIELFFAALCPRGARCVVALPTFEPILVAAERAGCVVQPLDGWAPRYPVAAARASLRTPHDRLVVVAPNNPTGAGLERDELAALLDIAGERPSLVDLAYHEFADDDLLGGALASPRACVLLSLSKAFGLAGLRVGCLVVPTALARTVRRARPVYPVASPSVLLARAALLRFGDLPARNAALVRRLRPRVAALLADAGLVVRPSQANFVLARGANAPAVAERLAAARIAVRRFDGRSDLEDALRVTFPTDEDGLWRLEQALATCAAGGAR